MRPFSGAFGSLSRRAISSRAIGMRPFAISPAGVAAEALEAHRRHVVDARHRHRGGDHRAQVDRLAEREAVGVEEAGAAARQPLGAERVEQAPLDVGREVARLGADVQLDVERHEARRVDLDVVAGQPEALDEAAQLVFERRVDAVAAAPVDGDEHRVPAAGPATRRDGALHARLAFGHRRIVGRGDGALLPAERLRRVEARLRQRLRVDAAAAPAAGCARARCR